MLFQSCSQTVERSRLGRGSRRRSGQALRKVTLAEGAGRQADLVFQRGRKLPQSLLYAPVWPPGNLPTPTASAGRLLCTAPIRSAAGRRPVDCAIRKAWRSKVCALGLGPVKTKLHDPTGSTSISRNYLAIVSEGSDGAHSGLGRLLRPSPASKENPSRKPATYKGTSQK